MDGVHRYRLDLKTGSQRGRGRDHCGRSDGSGTTRQRRFGVGMAIVVTCIAATSAQVLSEEVDIERLFREFTMHTESESRKVVTSWREIGSDIDFALEKLGFPPENHDETLAWQSSALSANSVSSSVSRDADSAQHAPRKASEVTQPRIESSSTREGPRTEAERSERPREEQEVDKDVLFEKEKERVFVERPTYQNEKEKEKKKDTLFEKDRGEGERRKEKEKEEPKKKKEERRKKEKKEDTEGIRNPPTNQNTTVPGQEEVMPALNEAIKKLADRMRPRGRPLAR
eukprot:TRINITY_DN70233_c0_g1_i1.p1 TRINITY_DN70233_c0_g1~~TRINITY_DN70233_c0_g1_i1.p1  ORF type:complete len:286 (+),score=63.07 TRINITY_DN70233_c0_g1_i1:168-1025(+)